METTAIVTCPRCGQKSQADVEAGDFPTRCAQCGTMACQTGDRGVKRPLEPIPVPTTIKSGTLAGILTARVPEKKPPAVAVNRSVIQAAATRPSGPQPDEVARVKARHNAIVKAQLRGNYQVLGAVGLLLGIIALLMLSALAIRGEGKLSRPAVTGVDSLHDVANR